MYPLNKKSFWLCFIPYLLTISIVSGFIGGFLGDIISPSWVIVLTIIVFSFIAGWKYKNLYMYFHSKLRK